MQRNILSWYMNAPLLWGALIHFIVLTTINLEYCQSLIRTHRVYKR